MFVQEDLYCVAYTYRGDVIGRVTLMSADVTANFNQRDEARIKVRLDPSWGAPVPPQWWGDNESPIVVSLQQTQPWVACMGVFDAASNEMLVYGPVVKRRRQSVSPTAGNNAGASTSRDGSEVEFECYSWEGWLDLVYPSLSHQASGSAAVSDEAAPAIRQVLFGSWDQHTPGESYWKLRGHPETSPPQRGTRAQREDSVAGRAGVGFGYCPIGYNSFALRGHPVYLDWDSLADKTGTATAWSLITEVLDQGVDFSLSYTTDPNSGRVLVFPRLDSPPIWTSTPESVAEFAVGDDVTSVTLTERGDLFAGLVRVSGTAGQRACYPDFDNPELGVVNSFLVEKNRPFQKGGDAPVPEASLRDRARLVQEALHPSPLEVSDLESKTRHAKLKPGQVVTVIVPKGVDSSSKDYPWQVQGRVASIRWGTSSKGCSITLIEPGSAAATGGSVAVYSNKTIPHRLSIINGNVSELQLG